MAKRRLSVGVEIDGSAKGYEKAAEDAKRATQQMKDKMRKDAQGARLGFDKLADTIKGITIAAAAMFAVKKVVEFGRSLWDMRIKAEGVQIAFERLNEPRLLDNLRKATRGTVNDLELMRATVSASNFRVPLEQLPTYFEFAQRRAQDTGESVDYLVDSIVKGIGRESALILDNLGISAKELNDQLKITPNYAVAVGEIIKRSMATSGKAIDTLANKVERQKAAADNLRLAWSNIGLFDKIADLKEGLTGVLEKMAIPKEYLNFWQKVSMTFGNAAHNATVLARALSQMEFDKAYAEAAKKDLELIPNIKVKQLQLKSDIDKLKEALDAYELEMQVKLVPVPDIDALDVYKDLARQEQKKQDWEKLLSPMDMFGDYENEAIKETQANIELINEGLTEHFNIWQDGQNELQRTIEFSQQLANGFGDMFRAGLDGWEAFGQAAKNTIKNIVAQLAAKAALFVLLNVLTGGTATAGTTIGKFLLGGVGLGGGGGGGGGMIGQSVIRGRDIYVTTMMQNEIRLKNT